MARLHDQSLLRQFVVSGDQRAFEALIQGYQQLVLGAAYRMTGNLHLAEEATQQTFVKLARKAGRLTSRKSLAGWLYLTASNQGRHLLRAEQRQRARDSKLCQEDDVLSNERCISEDVRWLSLEKALKSLSEREQDIIARRFFLDQSYDTIAQALKIGDAAARQRLSRALKRLGKRLRERQESIERLLISAAAVSLALPPLRLHADSFMIPADGSASLFGWRLADGLPMAKVAVIAVSVGALFFYHLTKPSSGNSVEAVAEEGAHLGLGLTREPPRHDHLVSAMSTRDALLLSSIIDFESKKAWVDHLELSDDERRFLETEALAYAKEMSATARQLVHEDYLRTAPDKGQYVYQLPHFDPEQKAFNAFKDRITKGIDKGSEDLMNLINHHAYGSHGKWNLTLRFNEGTDGGLRTEYRDGFGAGSDSHGFAHSQRKHGVILDDYRTLPPESDNSRRIVNEVGPPPEPEEEPEPDLPEVLPEGYKWVVTVDLGSDEPRPQLDWSRRAIGKDGLLTYNAIDLLQLPKPKALYVQAAYGELASALVAEAGPRISEQGAPDLELGKSSYVIEAFAEPMDDAFRQMRQSLEQLTTPRKAEWLIANVKDTNDYPGWGAFQLEINFQRRASPHHRRAWWAVVRIDPKTGERKGSLTGSFDARPGRDDLIEDLFTITEPAQRIRPEAHQVSRASLTIEPTKLHIEMRNENDVD